MKIEGGSAERGAGQSRRRGYERQELPAKEGWVPDSLVLFVNFQLTFPFTCIVADSDEVSVVFQSLSSIENIL